MIGQKDKLSLWYMLFGKMVIEPQFELRLFGSKEYVLFTTLY